MTNRREEPTTARHPVYAEGPTCSPYCPGTWSEYHDGYGAGFDRAEREAQGEKPAPLDMKRACRAEVNPWFEEGHEAGRLDPQVLADRILARLSNRPSTEPAQGEER